MNVNLERSLKDRIKALAKEEHRLFNDLWKTLVLERVLARLARSEESRTLIFKGGFLLSKFVRLGRETSDIDFSLKNQSHSLESVQSLIERMLSLPCDDGFLFSDVTVSQMNHPHMKHPGFEVSATASLGNTKTTVRMDLGVGDQVVPEYKFIPLLSLNNRPLFEPEISLLVYPLPYIFAEKLEAIIYRGGSNSRMKDYYDILLVSGLSEFSLDGSRDTINSVFAHRETLLPSQIQFDQQSQASLNRYWAGFRNALGDEFKANLPVQFTEVVQQVNIILSRLKELNDN
jgi:predicted nucleotidyltransferase component of viral defense system